MTRFDLRRSLVLLTLTLVPLVTMAAEGQRSGCAAANDPSIPDTTGLWDITYDDELTVEITIGGATHVSTLGSAGGVVEIEVDGQPLTFDLDCSRDEVVCPSEVWPSQAYISQEPDGIDAIVKVDLPTQTCDGELVDPDPETCGVDTHNPDCEQVCDGTLTTTVGETLGVVTNEGTKLTVFLGAGAASNGFNCALLGLSVAEATLDTIGSEERDTLLAMGMNDGVVATGYAGGCLWAGDPDADGQLDALVLGATVVFKTGFTGERAD